jgi:hypothetical protein
MGQPSEGLPLQNKKNGHSAQKQHLVKDRGALEDKAQIYLPSLHIKRGLTKICVGQKD